MTGTGRECGVFYYLDLSPKPIACSSFVFSFDHHCRLGHPSLQTLKLLLPELKSCYFFRLWVMSTR